MQVEETKDELKGLCPHGNFIASCEQCAAGSGDKDEGVEDHKPKTVEEFINRRAHQGNFEDFLSRRQKKETYPWPGEKEELAQFLGDSKLTGLVGAELPPHCLSSIKNVFSEDDLQQIRDSETPLLTFYGIYNYYRQIGIYEHTVNLNYSLSQRFDWHFASKDYGDLREPRPKEIAALGKLPLVYGTDYETLSSILADGRVWTDRENYEHKIANHAEDRDYIYSSNTNIDDRKMGLDDYVFTHFGKPQQMGQYGKIEILFKPNKFIDDNRAFATENDFQDYHIQNNSEGEDWYRGQILQGKRFYKAAVYRLKYNMPGLEDNGITLDRFLSGKTDRKDQYGGVSFATWEVKTKSLEMQDADSIVFLSISDLRRFQKEFPENKLPIKFKPFNKDIVAAIAEIYGEDTITKSLDQATIASAEPTRLVAGFAKFYPDIREKLEEYFGVKLALSQVETYTLQESNDQSEVLLEEELGEGGAERMQRLENSSEELTQFIMPIFSTYEIKPYYNIYKLSPGRIYENIDEAQADVNYVQAEVTRAHNGRRESGFGFDMMRHDPRRDLPPDRVKRRFIKVSCLKSQYDSWISRDRGRKQPTIQDYRIDSEFYLEGDEQLVQ